jgi:hypothetical protein
MLDGAVSPSKAKLRSCRRKVLGLAGSELLRFDLPPAPDPSGDRFSMMQPITTLVADAVAPSSIEAFNLAHTLTELPRISEARKAEAIERASVILTLTKDDAALIAAAFPHDLLVPRRGIGGRRSRRDGRRSACTFSKRTRCRRFAAFRRDCAAEFIARLRAGPSQAVQDFATLAAFQAQGDKISQLMERP